MHSTVIQTEPRSGFCFVAFFCCGGLLSVTQERVRRGGGGGLQKRPALLTVCCRSLLSRAAIHASEPLTWMTGVGITKPQFSAPGIPWNAIPITWKFEPGRF
jgi:hypothetical protein